MGLSHTRVGQRDSRGVNQGHEERQSELPSEVGLCPFGQIPPDDRYTTTWTRWIIECPGVEMVSKDIISHILVSCGLRDEVSLFYMFSLWFHLVDKPFLVLVGSSFCEVWSFSL